MPLKLVDRVVTVAVALLCASVAMSAERSATDSTSVTLLVSGVPSGVHPTLAACETEKQRRREADAAVLETGQRRYTCREDHVTLVRFTASPTCPPLPAPQGRVVDCPAGFAGAYTQTLSYTAAPYPTCAVPGEWQPTTPPASCAPIDSDNDGVPDAADECPTVHAPTPGGCPGIPPAGQWTFCANEWEQCPFSGTRRVRYGSGSTWVERDVTAVDGGVACRNSVFGDPTPGTVKRCELLSASSEPATGTATLSWSVPTRNDDGSVLSNLAGYRIHYGLTADNLALTVDVANPSATTHTITNLLAGTYYFGMRAYTTGGNQSVLSNVVSKVVR